MNLLGLIVSLLASSSNQRTSDTTTSTASSTPNTAPTSKRRRNNHLNLHNKALKWCFQKDAVILIDLENVRGKSFFHLSHREMLKRTALWTKLYNLENKVNIIVDHGSEHDGYYLPDGGIGIIFAGLDLKADDILARDVGSFHKNIAVVTSDNGLIARCASTMNRVHASNTNSIHFIKPIDFLNDLERLNSRIEVEKARLEKDGARNGKSEHLVKRITGRRRRSQLLYKHLASKEQECDGDNESNLVLLDKVITYDRQFEVDDVLAWEKDRNTFGWKEKTGDRVFLSEQFRRQVERVSLEQTDSAIGMKKRRQEASLDNSGSSPSLAYVMRVKDRNL